MLLRRRRYGYVLLVLLVPTSTGWDTLGNLLFDLPSNLATQFSVSLNKVWVHVNPLVGTTSNALKVPHVELSQEGLVLGLTKKEW